jgi:hypothetical protein
MACRFLPARRTREDSARARIGVDLISDTLPFGRLWHDGPQADENTIDYSKFTAAHMMP